MKIHLLLIISLFVAACSGTTVSTSDEFEQVTLPDGSVVSLNKDSEISYDSDFTERRVRLEGEAFFSVEEGETPFIVETEGGDIEVVGTEFNIFFRKGDLQVEVETGEVKMRAGGHDNGLRRGQRGHFAPGHNKIMVGPADFAFRVWLGDLQIVFRDNGREFKHARKHVAKEYWKMNKEYQKDMRKNNKEMQKGLNKALKGNPGNGGGGPKGNPGKGKGKKD